MFGFVSFGSGSSGNCYYLFDEEGGLFLDVGIGVRTLKKYCKECGIDLASAQAILVTHDHADHVKAAGSLSNEYNIPVYATETVHKHIDDNFVVHHKVDYPLRRYITIGQPFVLAGMTINTIPVPHDSSQNIGFRIERNGVVFVVLTDVGHVTTPMQALIGDANYLVIEANHEVEKLRQGTYPDYLKQRILSGSGHLSNSDCGMALAQYATPKLRHVWLCHLSYDNNDPELARYTVEGILRNHGIVPGKDFLLDVLKRTTPSDVVELR